MFAPCLCGLPLLSLSLSLAASVSVYGISLIHKICLMVSLRDRCLPLQQLLPQLICQRLTHVLLDSVYRIWIQAEAQVGVRFPPPPKSKFNIFVQWSATVWTFGVRFRFPFVYFVACFLDIFSKFLFIFLAAQKVCCKIELFMIERQPKVFHYEIKYGLGNNS